jgi:hypothetical protein
LLCYSRLSCDHHPQPGMRGPLAHSVRRRPRRLTSTVSASTPTPPARPAGRHPGRPPQRPSVRCATRQTASWCDAPAPRRRPSGQPRPARQPRLICPTGTCSLTMAADDPVMKDQDHMSPDRHPLGRPPRARTPSPHEILRVQPGASPAELRRAYRAAARSLHPDTNPSPDAAAQFAAVHLAWRTLTDPGSQTARHGHRGVGTIVFARRRPLPHRLWSAVRRLGSRRRRPPRVR